MKPTKSTKQSYRSVPERSNVCSSAFRRSWRPDRQKAELQTKAPSRFVLFLRMRAGRSKVRAMKALFAILCGSAVVAASAATDPFAEGVRPTEPVSPQEQVKTFK